MKGAWLIVLGGLIGAAVSYYYYITPGIGLDGEPGVLTVVISSLLMLAAGVALALGASGFIAVILVTLILLDIVGTGVCAWFLETPLLMAAMALAALGWVLRAIGHAGDRSVEAA